MKPASSRAVRAAPGVADILILPWAALLAAAALLAQGGAVSDRLDELTHLAPLYLAAALVVAALALAFARAWRRLAVSLAVIAAFVSGGLMLPEFQRATGPTAPPDAPGRIKIIQFNAWEGNRRPDDVAAWLAAQHADIIVVEEIGSALRDRIIERTGWRSAAGYNSSTMIFTPAPYRIMRRPTVDRASQLTFVNATYADASGPFEVVATHLSWPGPVQTRQRAALREVVSALPSDRMILVGDFNSAPWSFARRRDDHDLGLIRRDRALWSWPADVGGARPWRAPFPILPIDHVYAGPGWATVSVARGPRLGSDHYPVIVTLAPVAGRSGPS